MKEKDIKQLAMYTLTDSSSIDEDEEKLLRQFLESAKSGDVVVLKNMVDEIGRVDGLADMTETYESIMDPSGLNALHYAAFGGKVLACKYLINKVKIDISALDWKGETPLHHAIKGGHDVAAVYLIQNGARINVASDEGLTALHYAADKGSRDVMNLLISNGAAVDAVAAAFGTPLHRAAYYGKKESVEILLNHHACPDGLGITLGNLLHTPLGASITSSSLECVDLLTKAGAKLNAPSCGLSPLQLAAAMNENEILKYLLEKGADPAVYYLDSPAILLAGLECNYEAIEILFPKTPRLPKFSKWSVDELVRHFKEYQVDIVMKGAVEHFRIYLSEYSYALTHAEYKKAKHKLEEYAEYKENGTDAFQKEENADAKSLYSKALDRIPGYIWLRRNLMDASENAAYNAEALEHFRQAQAYMLLKDPVKSADSYSKALLLNPDKKEFQSGLWSAINEEFNYMRNLSDLFKSATPSSSPDAKKDVAEVTDIESQLDRIKKAFQELKTSFPADTRGSK